MEREHGGQKADYHETRKTYAPMQEKIAIMTSRGERLSRNAEAFPKLLPALDIVD